MIMGFTTYEMKTPSSLYLPIMEEVEFNNLKEYSILSV